jgi:hypothetical protein
VLRHSPGLLRRFAPRNDDEFNPQSSCLLAPQRDGDLCEQTLEQLSCAVVQASWQDEPIEPAETEAVPVVCAAIDEPLAPGKTQLV